MWMAILRLLGSILKFGWPILAWNFLIDPAVSAFGSLGGGLSGGFLVGLCAVLITYDARFRIVAFLSAAYVVVANGDWLARFVWWAWEIVYGGVPDAKGRLVVYGWDRFFAAMQADPAAGYPDFGKVVGVSVSFAAACAVAVYALPGAMELLRALSLRGALKFEESTSGLHGSARFATKKELTALSAKAEKMPRTLILGQVDQKGSDLVRWPLEAHLVCLAPTRTGKGVSQIITNVLHYSGPVVVIDPKAESLMIAGRHRAKTRMVAAVDPYRICARFHANNPEVYSPPIASWNPLDFIEPETAVSDVNSIMDALFAPAEGKANSDSDHFTISAKRVIRGLILRAMDEDEPERRNLLTVRNWLIMPAETRKEFFVELEQSNNPVIQSAGSLLATAGDRELGSILSTAQNALQWLDVPQLAETVSKSTISMDDLLEGKMDMFICIPGERLLPDIKGFVRLFSSLPVAAAMRRRAKERILVILDEAPLVGKLESVIQAFRVAAGLNLSVWIFAQTLKGLEDSYGKSVAHELIGNAEVVPIFGAGQTNMETNEWVSKALGDMTVITESVNSSSGKSAKITDVFASNSNNSGSSRQEAKRPLMLPSDIAQMNYGQILSVTRAKHMQYPMEYWQARYFEHPEFAGKFDHNPHTD